MIPERYVWLAWSSAFLVPWIALYTAFPRHRRSMLWASLFTTPFGGVGAVLVNVLTGRRSEPLPAGERHHPRHRFHLLALASPFVVFPILWFPPWNPIYPGIVAMLIGAVATVACRPDLLRNTLIGASVFTAYYALFLAGLELTEPGYIDRVWNLDSLSGWTLFGLPLEELLFAAGFGGYWAGVYEHFTWHRSQAPRRHEL